MANILVVDDELGIRDLLSEILNDEGHAVEVAENAARAREAFTRERPDLVLLDIWMPDTDGVTLLKEWSAGGLLSMPVIMMSGHATIDTAVEATKIGALAFLEKPITLQKLLKAVELGLSKGKPAPAAPTSPVPASEPPPPALPARVKTYRRGCEKSNRGRVQRGPARGVAYRICRRSPTMRSTGVPKPNLRTNSPSGPSRIMPAEWSTA